MKEFSECEWYPISLNEMVKFYPDKEGYEIYKNHYIELFGEHSWIDYKNEQKKFNGENCFKIQFYEFIRIFGPAITKSDACQKVIINFQILVKGEALFRTYMR